MNELPDWETYYAKEADIVDFSPDADPLEIHRCLAGWSVLPRGKLRSLVDVGCGDGSFCGWVAQRRKVDRIVGADVSGPRLARARSRFPDVEFVEAKVPTLPFQDNEFHATTCIQVLEHVEDPEVALYELARISSKYVIVSVPYKEKLQTLLCPWCLRKFPASGHLHSFDAEKLSCMVHRAGLEVECLRVYYRAPGAARNVLLRKLCYYLKRIKLLVFPSPYGKFLVCRAVKKDSPTEDRRVSSF